ncbi:hypothetical protein SAMN04488535_0759 [Corynebacterium mycetoides]|uniref:Methylase n=1 Tax=Corynebacterium mycetoides TaxID=38302 RepID=A0A1G9MUZ7_9CORY|nr:hypothetical protein [Corynebacterium mycetoides]SDL78092.1 hypothetical protein SAMN04488535_0759 [Corynebacterium mycetoides]
MTAAHDLPQRRQVLINGGRVEVIVKSRDRVRAYGEVFTPVHMVEKMLDLVSPELETGPGFVDKTFFEPAAGDGNFLTAIYRRKLSAIQKRYKPGLWKDESLFALASIYAVEFLEDNHADAQANLLGEFVNFHKSNGVACGPRTNLFKAASYLIAMNIRCGNTLTGLDNEGQKITFSWWHRILNSPPMVQREVFTLNSLREASQDQSVFDFDSHPTYAQCRIDQVHKEESADV